LLCVCERGQNDYFVLLLPGCPKSVTMGTACERTGATRPACGSLLRGSKPGVAMFRGLCPTGSAPHPRGHGPARPMRAGWAAERGRGQDANPLVLSAVSRSRVLPERERSPGRRSEGWRSARVTLFGLGRRPAGRSLFGSVRHRGGPKGVADEATAPHGGGDPFWIVSATLRVVSSGAHDPHARWRCLPVRFRCRSWASSGGIREVPYPGMCALRDAHP
jgi:hypothetical protein